MIARLLGNICYSDKYTMKKSQFRNRFLITSLFLNKYPRTQQVQCNFIDPVLNTVQFLTTTEWNSSYCLLSEATESFITPLKTKRMIRSIFHVCAKLMFLKSVYGGIVGVHISFWRPQKCQNCIFLCFLFVHYCWNEF